MINFFKRLSILLLFFNVNFLLVNCFTNSKTKSKINYLDYKSNKNFNNKSSNYVLGFKVQNNENSFYLIEFETNKKSTFMILAGEEQLFYDYQVLKNIKSELSSSFRYINLENLNNELPLIWKKAKDLKCEDVISIDKHIELTVKNIIPVKLNTKMNLDSFFKDGNYIFFLSNLSGLPFDKSLIKCLFSLDSLLVATLGALFFGTIGAINISFKGFMRDVLSPGLVAKGFSRGAKIGALDGLFVFWILVLFFKYSDFLSEKLFNYIERNPEVVNLYTLLGLYDENPIPTLTQQGKVTVFKVDYLSKIMKQLNSLNISFAEIGFVNEKDFNEKKDNLLENFSNDLFFDEKLFDTNGNPIKNENGNVAHLFIVGNKER
ncbi:MAG: hypothetical protein ABIA74_01510 [bacterium]